jgi:putative sterol carrier protein
MTVAESLEGLKSSFNAAAAAGLNKTIQLNITGDDAGVYSIRVANQECELLSESVAKPDLTLTTSDQNWLAIAQGQLDAMNAFLAGKVKASGDMMLAMRIPQLFKLK